MRRVILFLVGFMGLFGTIQALAQTTPVPLPITGNLGAISGTGQPYAGVSIQLQNCPSPVSITGYFGIVQTGYQIRANSSGLITGSVWSNDLITCNGTTGNSQYNLTLMNGGVPSGTPQCYQVVSTQGAWNLNTQQPIACSQTPPNPQDAQYRNLNVTGCLSVDGSGCSGSGGSGTVSSGTANQLAFYPSTGETVSGTTALPTGTMMTATQVGTAGTLSNSTTGNAATATLAANATAWGGVTPSGTPSTTGLVCTSTGTTTCTWQPSGGGASGAVLLAPSGNQTITQPNGSTLAATEISINSSPTVISNSLNQVGSGYSLGNNGTSAQGWGGGYLYSDAMFTSASGITDLRAMQLQCQKTGDCFRLYAYLGFWGGLHATSDEGSGVDVVHANQQGWVQGTVATPTVGPLNQPYGPGASGYTYIYKNPGSDTFPVTGTLTSVVFSWASTAATATTGDIVIVTPITGTNQYTVAYAIPITIAAGTGTQTFTPSSWSSSGSITVTTGQKIGLYVPPSAVMASGTSLTPTCFTGLPTVGSTVTDAEVEGYCGSVQGGLTMTATTSGPSTGASQVYASGLTCEVSNACATNLKTTFADGGYLVDTSKGGATLSISSPTVVDNAETYTVSSGTVTPSTAWGAIIPSSCTNNGNGQYHTQVTTTCNVQLGTSPASPGSFVTTSHACLAARFMEEVQITAAGTPSAGVQSISFKTIFAWDNANGNTDGGIIMQDTQAGALCGSAFVASSPSNWPIAYPVLGAFSSTQLVIGNCYLGGCNNSVPPALNTSTATPGTLHPAALITGTLNGSQGGASLDVNAIPFALGDTVIGAPDSAVQIALGNYYVAQYSPLMGNSPSTGLTVYDTGTQPFQWIFSCQNNQIGSSTVAAAACHYISGGYTNVIYSTYRPRNGGTVWYVEGADPDTPLATYKIFADNARGGASGRSGAISFDPNPADTTQGFGFNQPVTAPSFNGVALTTDGSSSTYLNGAGGYTTPSSSLTLTGDATGSGSGSIATTVTQAQGGRLTFPSTGLVAQSSFSYATMALNQGCVGTNSFNTTLAFFSNCTASSNGTNANSAMVNVTNAGELDLRFSPGQGMYVIAGDTTNVAQFAASGVQFYQPVNMSAGGQVGGSNICTVATGCGASGTVSSGSAYSPTYYTATGMSVGGITPCNGLESLSTSAAPGCATSSQVQAAIGSQVVYANTLSGSDPGAQINAADTLLGSSPGVIVYNAATSGTVTTGVTLSANHTLVLQTALIWPGGTYINLPTGSSGQVVSCPGTQTFSSGSLVQGISVSNVRITGCNISGPSSTSGQPNLAYLTSSNHVQIDHNTLTNVNLLNTASTAAFSSCPGSSCQYPNITTSNANNYFILTDNNATAVVGNTSAFILTYYVNNVTISNNHAYGYLYGVQWFGGDACVGSGCGTGGNGSFSNPPKATTYLINDNDFVAQGSCIWGSMGQYMTIDNNHCNAITTTGSDVGIDLEGTWDSIVSNNQVGYTTPYQNGQLTTFFLATRNQWIGNKIYTAGSTINLNNATNQPGGLIETFQGNTIVCTATSACGMGIQSTDTINFWDNILSNTEILINGANYSQLNVERNTLAFTVATANGIDLEGFNNGPFGFGQAVVRGNKVYTALSQSGDAIKIVGRDYSSFQQAFIENNIMSYGGGSWTTDIYAYAASANSAGQYLTVDIRDNSLSSGTVVTGAASNTAIYARTMNNYLTLLEASSAVTFPYNVSSNTVVPQSSATSGEFVQYIDSNGVQHLGAPSIISTTYSTAPTGTCIAGAIVAGDVVFGQDGTQAVCGSGSTGWVQVNCMANKLPWTPTDNSGAGLTFSNVKGSYYRCGKQVTAFFTVIYPSTSNTAVASIGGLPFAPDPEYIDSSVIGTALYGYNGGQITFAGNGSNTFFYLCVPGSSGVSNVTITNANMSGAQLRGSLTYFVP